MELIEKIENEIKAKRLNKTELAKNLGISRGVVYNLGLGTSIGTVFKIIEALGKKPEDFFKPMNDFKKVAKLSHIEEEAEVYGQINYKQKYYETLEKLNLANERIMAFTDQKKDLIKKKK